MLGGRWPWMASISKFFLKVVFHNCVLPLKLSNSHIMSFAPPHITFWWKLDLYDNRSGSCPLLLRLYCFCSAYLFCHWSWKKILPWYQIPQKNTKPLAIIFFSKKQLSLIMNIVSWRTNRWNNRYREQRLCWSREINVKPLLVEDMSPNQSLTSFDSKDSACSFEKIT